jgi:predicted GNAT family acetyltransferase
MYECIVPFEKSRMQGVRGMPRIYVKVKRLKDAKVMAYFVIPACPESLSRRTPDKRE